MQRNHIFMALGGLGVVLLAGLLLGLWLSWHAPADMVAATAAPQPQTRVGSAEAPVAQIDAEAFVPEPPQPRLDGTRGVLRRPVPASNPIPMVSAIQAPQPDTILSTVAPDLSTLQEQYEAAKTPPAPQVIVAPPAAPITTVDATSSSAPSLPITAGGFTEGWMVALRADLDRCASQGAVSRALCNEQARWKHCSANNGWGRIPECPATGNN
jgi:hypothetical protein